MTDPTRTNDSLSDKANAAFQQATAKVIQRAKQMGTPLIVWEDEQLKELPPEELEQRAAAVDSASSPKTPRHFGLGKGKLTIVQEDDEHREDFKE